MSGLLQLKLLILDDFAEWEEADAAHFDVELSVVVLRDAGLVLLAGGDLTTEEALDLGF